MYLIILLTNLFCFSSIESDVKINCYKQNFYNKSVYDYLVIKEGRFISSSYSPSSLRGERSLTVYSGVIKKDSLKVTEFYFNSYGHYNVKNLKDNDATYEDTPIPMNQSVKETKKGIEFGTIFYKKCSCNKKMIKVLVEEFFTD